MRTKNRVIALSLLIVLGFLLGYFNQVLSVYFLNYNALIGLLTAIIVVLSFALVITHNRYRDHLNYQGNQKGFEWYYRQIIEHIDREIKRTRIKKIKR